MMAGEEEEYNSDPEGAIRSLAMRRREASDDEEGSVEDAEEKKLLSHTRANDDSDGQGGVEDYDDDEGEEVIGGDELDDVEDDERLSDEEEYPGDRGHFAGAYSLDADEEAEELEPERRMMGAEPVIQVTGDVENAAEAKENEPYAVPTAGAFYMHDDRFRNSARGRHKRTFGGRKLWESKDERKWGHDKFEEMSSRERRNNNNGRRGNYRGQTRNSGYNRSYAKGGGNRSANPNYNPRSSLRGRGPRRYDHLQNKGNREKSVKTTAAAAARSPLLPPPVPASTKQAFTSSLSSASPPFYPSGSSNNERNRDEVDMTKLSIEDSIPSSSSSSSSSPQTGSIQPRAGGGGSGLMFIHPSGGHSPLNLASLTQTPLARQMFAQNRAGGPLLPNIGELENSSSERSFQFKGTLANPPDSKFPATPAILPVMQFAGQHRPGGLGVPAVGMAFPGYVAQPGLASSEMTWLPVLAAGAAAAAAGGTFPPYLAVDGAYPSRRESSPSTNNNNNTRVSSPSPESASNEGEQDRPHKPPPPRRYSAMTFGR